MSAEEILQPLLYFKNHICIVMAIDSQVSIKMSLHLIAIFLVLGTPIEISSLCARTAGFSPYSGLLLE